MKDNSRVASTVATIAKNEEAEIKIEDVETVVNLIFVFIIFFIPLEKDHGWSHLGRSEILVLFLELADYVA